jgi:CRISPR/Cas system CSM-associated protein Csm4 (group 5 of RAMP superfamily)
MTNLFNAEDAKQLSKSNDPNELLKTILGEIKEKASMGKWEYITRNYGFGESILYDSECNYPEKIKHVLYGLRDLGFDVTIVTKECQFVDIYLQVTWS